MIPSLLLVLLATTYTFLGAIVSHFARRNTCAATYTFNEVCWFVQGLLTLPWQFVKAIVYFAQHGSYLALCETAKLCARSSGRDEAEMRELIGMLVVVVAVMRAALWMSSTICIQFSTTPILVPFLKFV